MSDLIPFDIQREIIKNVSDVKPLIRFRSVSKQWKSFIDSSKFIKGYTQQHSCTIISYKKYDYDDNEPKYICLDDYDETLFKALFVVSPLIKQSYIENLVGASHGLLCSFGYHKGYNKFMVVIWNPSIRKSFGLAVPQAEPLSFIFGFGVCSVTSDPTVVKFTCCTSVPHFGVLLRVDVFTLSSGVWTEIPISNWPRKSIKLNRWSTNVVIDRFIYWGAVGPTNDYDSRNHMVASFDLITKEFSVIDLPKSLTNELCGILPVAVCKLRESLVVYGGIRVEEEICCGLWVMEHDLSSTKLFTISADVNKILGFRKSGEPVFEPCSEPVFDAAKGYDAPTTLHVYDPCSQKIKNLGIVGSMGSFFTGSYKESLLLLDHLDLQIYVGDNL